MAISLRDIMDDGTTSARQQALNNNLSTDGNTPYEPFTLRELITPQYRVNVDSSTEYWDNWVLQHGGYRTEYRPSNRKQLIAAVVEKAHSEGRVRAVGSGHSHSNAPEAPEHYIDLNPAGPGTDPKGNYEEKALNSVLGHKDWVKDDTTPGGIDADYLKRVEAGVVLRRLNRHILHENGYALKNMGSFDGQTVAGAVNTSTHGTGVGLSSFADSVESVEIATVPESASGNPIVRLYRIEPSDGITDREAFERATGDHEMELIQDDDVFYSTVVGYGCMGVAYAYTLHVRDSYWLREETKLKTWSDLTSALENSSNEITEESVERFLTRKGCRHTQILVNIAADQVGPSALKTHDAHGIGKHETENDPLCLVTRHYEVENQKNIPVKPGYWDIREDRQGDARWPPERDPKTAKYIAKELPIHPLKRNLGKPELLHENFFHSKFKNDPFYQYNKSAWYVALRRLRDGGENASEYYNPEPPEPPAPTVEVGVALGDIVDAVNEARARIQTIKQGDQIQGQGKLYDGEGKDVFFPAPMGLRFTAASEHYLSPEHDRKTAMLEVPLPIYSVGAGPVRGVPELSSEENLKWVIEPALSKLHNHLVFTGNSNIQFDARPHMGKHNEVGDGWLRANYDRYASDSEDETAWLDVYDRFNAFGTFNNEFTKQIGIDNP